MKVVGRGAHGFAILCKRKKDSSLVVIKELFGNQIASAQQESLNEIQVLSIVRHPNIIAYFDSFTAEAKEEFEINEEEKQGEEAKATTHKKSASNVPSTLYIVMEYADGIVHFLI